MPWIIYLGKKGTDENSRFIRFLKKGSHFLFFIKNTKKEIPFTTTSIDKLFDYLSATGEYYFELKELNYFKEYLKTKNKTEIEKILKEESN